MSGGRYHCVTPGKYRLDEYLAAALLVAVRVHEPGHQRILRDPDQSALAAMIVDRNGADRWPALPPGCAPQDGAVAGLPSCGQVDDDAEAGCAGHHVLVGFGRLCQRHRFDHGLDTVAGAKREVVLVLDGASGFAS